MTQNATARTMIMASAVLLLAGAAAAGTRDRPHIISVSHLSIYSSEATTTERFFVHELGAFKASDPQNPQGVRYYFNPVQFVEVLPLPDGPPSINRFDHAAFNVASAEDMRRYLGAHDIAVPTAISTGSDGSRYFEVRDPEGNRIQFVQPPPHPRAVPPNPLSNHIIHVGFIVHDPQVEDRFYHELLGFRPYWHGGMTEDSSQWIAQQVPDGSDWLEYMVVKGAVSQETAGVFNHFSLGVQNIEQSMNLLYEGDRLTGKHSPPQIGRDGKWQLNLYDPDGTRAELMEFQPRVKPCCSPFLLPSPTH
jgi:catechol 2,3-dioxygenase-like lactoylglutathione lyase family enzyme